MSNSRAVVLLSGGLDSTTVLAIAHSERLECHVADALGAASHRVITLDLRAIGGSALTDDIEVPKDQDPESGEVPITYVPARNTILLSLLLGLAEVVEADQLFIGANAVDYSGYPDCRPAFLQTFEDLYSSGSAPPCSSCPRPTSSAAASTSASTTASPGRATTRPPTAMPAAAATRAFCGGAGSRTLVLKIQWSTRLDRCGGYKL